MSEKKIVIPDPEKNYFEKGFTPSAPPPPKTEPKGVPDTGSKPSPPPPAVQPDPSKK
jgi:hypothetical protein